MVYRRRQLRTPLPGGFHRFQNAHRTVVYGYGEGDYIRLKDEYGNMWRGMAVREDDQTIRYRFRDQNGSTITGICDSYGVILRDERGRTWRGFVD